MLHISVAKALRIHFCVRKVLVLTGASIGLGREQFPTLNGNLGFSNVVVGTLALKSGVIVFVDVTYSSLAENKAL